MPALPWRASEPVAPTASYVLTITRLPLRTHWRIPTMMRATLRITRTLKRTDGLIGYSLKADLIRKTFWTASAWRDDAAVTRFVNSDTHRAALDALQPHMGDARIETLTVTGSDLPPTWTDVEHRLMSRAAART